LSGDQIPLTARILQITDIYDALVTDRPYRKALSHEEAIDTMRREARRGWWDNNLIDEFGVLLGYHAPVVDEIKVTHVF
jgi:putative two-component system response regulator